MSQLTACPNSDFTLLITLIMSKETEFVGLWIRIVTVIVCCYLWMDQVMRILNIYYTYTYAHMKFKIDHFSNN